MAADESPPKVAPPQAGEGAESVDRRVTLAEDRTLLAAERTYAAWIRTGLVAFASGAGAPTLLIVFPAWLTKTSALIALGFSFVCFAMAAWRQLPSVRPLTGALRAPGATMILASALFAAVSLGAFVMALMTSEFSQQPAAPGAATVGAAP
jgi:putative membrane protein